MTNVAKEAIGSFVVITKKREETRVVVSQQVTSYYEKDAAFIRKFMNLDDLDGPEVFKTKNPKVFRLKDGTELRKRTVLA